MRFENLRILIVSPEDWGSSWVSKHHYAMALAEAGNQVIFVGPGRNATLQKPDHKRLRVIEPPKIPRGIRRYPGPVRRALHGRMGRELERAAGGSFELIWSFDPSRFLDLDCVSPGARTIFFVADFDDTLPWRLPATSADLCLGCSRGILERVRKAAPSARFVHHGYSDHPAKPYSFKTAGPNVVYGGNLAHQYLEVPRAIRLLESYPNVNFHFFGEDGTGNLGDGQRCELAERLLQFENATLHGPVAPSLLPGIYRQADALLVLHRPSFDEVGNPHKMMEYLGSGRPILSTVLGDYEEISDLIEMHDDVEKYCLALGEILETDPEGLRERRIGFARDHSYVRQLERISQMLDQSGHRREKSPGPASVENR